MCTPSGILLILFLLDWQEILLVNFIFLFLLLFHANFWTFSSRLPQQEVVTFPSLLLRTLIPYKTEVLIYHG